MATFNESEHRFQNWQARIWRIVVIGFGVCVLFFVIYACYMLHAQIGLLLISAKTDSLAAITGTGMLGSQFLRGLSILIGGAVIFGGLSISFFSGSDMNSFSRGGDNDVGKVSISTKTPGIVGVLVGGVIIIYAIQAPYYYEHTVPITKTKMISTNVPANERTH
ncbi:UNVERIFIED_ORG: hypothetical protein M2402_004350 [Rahnella aquatilis]